MRPKVYRPGELDLKDSVATATSLYYRNQRFVGRFSLTRTTHMSTFTITSTTGKAYTFSTHNPYSAWKEVAGVYMFLNPLSNGNWGILYIGQTENFSKRLPPNHECWDEAKRKGATAIGATVVMSAVERLDLEKELIQRYQPSMNVQHRAGLMGNQMRGLFG